MKQEILKLNKNFFPLEAVYWQKVFVDIFSGAAFPLDIVYELTEHGNIDINKIESFDVVKTFEEWAMLPVRPFDDFVSTAHSVIRLPTVVVCARFDQIPIHRAEFPTSANIYKRDNYTCQYTGEKLTKDLLSIDHILPRSRGGKNTWENLCTANRNLNTWKADRLPKECGLQLIQVPKKPQNGLAFDFLRKEWEMFVGGGDFESS